MYGTLLQAISRLTRAKLQTACSRHLGFQDSHELQACSLRQCEVNISKDVFAMVEWSKLCREASNREGHLDVKFLNARYNKGVKQVQDFMEANHKYFETSIGLQDAQAEILKFQRKFDNGNGQLDRFKSIWVFKTRPNPLSVHCVTTSCCFLCFFQGICHLEADAFDL